MKIRLTNTRLLLLLLLIIKISGVKAQHIAWKDHPGKTYVFEISNKEAEKLLKSSPKDSLILKMQHTPVGSFVGEWTERPKQGHFIFANINRNNVSYGYAPVMPFQVFLFREYGVLTLQVVDSEGKIRDDAKVKIKGAWRLFDTGVDFDKESHTYTIDDSSDKHNRLLTVELDKFTVMFNLSKHFIDPWYGGNNYYGGGGGPDFYSYMITDKNKYKPGETVRFKSYALSGSRKPMKDNLEVWMSSADTYQYKKIKSIVPYNPGGFAGEVQLHDSLKLKLDKSYNIRLSDKKGRIVATTSFKYEDYELYDSRIETKIKSNTHFYPDTNKLEIKAMDANGLLLQDLKAEVTVTRSDIARSYTDLLIVPDVLMSKTITLDNNEPTNVDIPYNLFGESDCSYDISVQARTYDNQVLTSKHYVRYFKSHYDIAQTMRNDTIGFSFSQLGIEKKVKAELSYNDGKEKKIIELPYEELFNQAQTSYNLKVLDPLYYKGFATDGMKNYLDIKGGIATDSFNVELVNPLKLELSWYIYQGNTLLSKGSGTEFDFKYPNTDLEVAHYVEIFYFMGKTEQTYRRTFVPKTEFLDVQLDMPERVYPGQTIDATITVKDNMGAAVKNADLTAFAVNSQLKYYVPDLPYYGASPRTREERSSYSINKKDYSFYVPLDYKYWNRMANLEDLEYYQFTYPWDKTFRYTVDTPDSTTQYAPFVMKDGKAIDIYAIEQNGVPVYFSWTDQPKGYSLSVSDTVYNKIALRLHDRALILDSLRFEKGKKTILSIDIDHLPENVKVLKIDTRDKYGNYQFTDQEKSTYRYYISKVPVDKNYDFTYLRYGKTIYPVFHKCFQSNRSEVTIGPIPQGKMQYMNTITYKHEGGYSYEYDDNVVYKSPYQTYPSNIVFSSNNNFTRLNDFALTPAVFDKKLAQCKMDRNDWNPSEILISQSEMKLKFSLPYAKDTTGVSNLLFRSHKTGKILFPDQVEYSTRKYSQIDPGMYDVILLYNSGKYVRYNDVPFTSKAFTWLNMSKQPICESDSTSRKWLLLKSAIVTETVKYYTASTSNTYYTPTIIRTAGNTVKGTVSDSSGEPLIGVTVSIKGTTLGTITDIDGRFEIAVDREYNTLVFGYIGFTRKEETVMPGSEITVRLEEEQSMLSEVVVVGYGTMRKSSLTGSVMTISGDERAPKARPEKLDEDDTDDNEVKNAEDKLYNELLQLNGLRSNFSDVGFWKPDLVTDKKGQAKFTVTFPDNITQWNAVVYAMNRKLKTGTARKSIKSYKPLMAELKNPQFLVVGDSAYYAGNIRNYTGSKDISGRIMFSVAQDTLMNKAIDFTSSHQDKMLVTPLVADSLTTTYLFTRNDGYNDGEKRTISVEPQGTMLAEGTLSFLRNGDKLDVEAAPNEDLHITITGKQIDIYMDATYYLTGYKYACNEQLASKLMGLLNYKTYKEFREEKFKNDKQINEIIKRLVENQNDKKLWSWWGRSSSTSFWMSAHVIRALNLARKAGYTVNLDLTKIEQDYTDAKSYRGSSLYDIEILDALSEAGTKQNYKAAIESFEKTIRDNEHYEDSICKLPKRNCYRTSYLKEKLLLTELRQKYNLGYSSENVTKYLKKDVLGAMYCDDGIANYYWYSDNMMTTLIAYRIIKNDSTLQHLKEPIQMYILGTKQNGWNTYQASSAVSTILPDLIAESVTKDKLATVVLSGKDNKTLTEFPYETKLSAGEHLNIEKKDGIPLIYSAYSWKRVIDEKKGDAFEVKSYLNDGDNLTAGMPATLTVTVKVKQKNAEHIMIEIPIPAGCSYASKPNYFYGREVHREYFKEKTVIFCESLPMGDYDFSIQLLPRYTGQYILNPAKAEMMYFPVINANNAIRKIKIGER